MSTSSSTPDRFLVLLSTHNGAEYLREQIESVFHQREVQVELHVRDDGSTDDTLRMLTQIATANRRVSFAAGERLGAAKSYLTMLSEASDGFDYIALCDQDDVWVDGKLARAAQWLAGQPAPAMYCSAVEVVDASLRHIGIHRTCRRGPALENALVQNIATGCTIVLNRYALPLFREVPSEPVMHDWWIYAVTAAAGIVLYDPSTWVRYRQHGANSIGLSPSRLEHWVRRFRRQMDGGAEGARTRQAAELLEMLGSEMTPAAQYALNRFVESQTSIVDRVRYSLTGPAYRQRRIDSLLSRFLYALGRL
jgi:glycosyltransferase involved in cell wall biosynthesis